MTAAALVLSARNRFEHLFDALVDPARAHHGRRARLLFRRLSSGAITT
jgi:hypothetical protein